MLHVFKTPSVTAMVAMGLAGMAAPAMAQTGETPFDGAYVGAGVGLNNFDYKVTGQDVSDTGFAYDALVGYRRTLQGGFVAGVEGHLGGSTAKDSVMVNTGGEQSYNGTDSLGRYIGLDGLLGKTFGPDNRILGFVTAGYMNQKVTSCCTLTPSGQEGILDVRSVSDTEGGYRIGAGVEYKLMYNLAWRATVHYADTGRADQTQFLTGVTVGF